MATALLGKSINFVFFVTLPMIAGLFVLSDMVISLLAGNAFQKSIQPFEIMLPIIVLNAITVVYGNQVFLAHHQERMAFIVLIISGIFGFTFNMVF